MVEGVGRKRFTRGEPPAPASLVPLPVPGRIVYRLGVTDDTLTLDIDGWEGPLDLLLTLARHQKVDLRAISILALAEQYLVFVEEMRAVNLELAADYLVMAAWLAYLKSALLLPRDPAADPDPDGAGAAAAAAARTAGGDARCRRAADGARPARPRRVRARRAGGIAHDPHRRHGRQRYST